MKRIIAGLTAIIMLAGLSFSNNEIIPNLFNTVSVSAEELTLENGLKYEIVTDENGKETIIINGFDDEIKDTIESVEIPEEINKIPVTSIRYVAFYGCTSLTKINIPDSVTFIGYSAFEGCSSLTEINIPDSVTSIGSSAFLGCTSLTKINIPDSVASIDTDAFSDTAILNNKNTDLKYVDNWLVQCGNKEIEKVEFKEGTKGIAGGTFYNCTLLKEINIPDSVTSIGGWAFSSCTSLTEINIPDSVASIENSAFLDCSSLTKINIPDSVTSIGDLAFSGCTSLTEINIPDSVASIGNWAFRICTSLTEINIPDSVTSIENRAFQGCSSLTEITILNPKCEIYDYSGTISNGHDSDYKYYFDGTIRGYENSTAKAYAEKYGYKFESLGEYAEPEKNADIDGDGTTSSNDALNILQVLTNTAEFTDEQKKLADLDGDGEITSADALIILQMIVGLR